jgi:RNA polymerase sigma-70 factor (ECF subfamily)
VTARSPGDSSRAAAKDRTAAADRGAQVLVFPERSLTDTDDATLVRILLNGDSRAPYVVWKRFAPMVFGMLKRAFGPDHTVDDLAQEVFLVLFDRVEGLREPRALRAFLVAIVAHTIRREIRRKTTYRWLHLGGVPDAPANGVDLDAREAVRRLYRILDRLGRDERTAFTLRYFEGMDVEDVAAAMGLSLTTAKRRLAHACLRVTAHAQRDAGLVEYLAQMNLEAPQ